MVIIITMAGLGSRFKNAGYDKPKYEIEVKGKTLFEWSLDSLKAFNDSVEYIFICRNGNLDFIKDKTKDIKIRKIININYLTSGQAETVLLAEPYIDDLEDIFIYNIDTYIEPYQICPEQFIDCDGMIPCFKGEGDKWSFVRLYNDKVVELTEKIRISDNCSIGAYYFKSFALYVYCFNEYYKYWTDKEKYIAPIYNMMINEGNTVKMTLIDAEKVHILGTPEDLKEFIKK